MTLQKTCKHYKNRVVITSVVALNTRKRRCNSTHRFSRSTVVCVQFWSIDLLLFDILYSKIITKENLKSPQNCIVFFFLKTNTCFNSKFIIAEMMSISTFFVALALCKRIIFSIFSIFSSYFMRESTITCGFWIQRTYTYSGETHLNRHLLQWRLC